MVHTTKSNRFITCDVCGEKIAWDQYFDGPSAEHPIWAKTRIENLNWQVLTMDICTSCQGELLKFFKEFWKANTKEDFIGWVKDGE